MLCLVATGTVMTLAVQSFTLAWTHSIEKVRWEEDYRVAGTRLELVEARVQGSAAGMEPAPGARFHHGWWRYAPALRWHAELRLTRSPYADDYEICTAGRCQSLAALVPQREGITRVFACG